MEQLRELKALLDPAFEIASRSATPRYLCTKCTNQRERRVKHYTYTYKILHPAWWSGTNAGPLLYLLTAVFPRLSIEVGRYVGIWKGINLEGRWTRVPRAIALLPCEQRFIHHSYDTQRRLEIDHDDPAFRDASAFHRIYVISSAHLHEAKTRGRLATAAPFDLSPVADEKTQYAKLKRFEGGVAHLMKRLGLQPWNDLPGDRAIPSARVTEIKYAF